jgi:hypothetical protein
MMRSRCWYGLLVWLASCAPSTPAQHAEAGAASKEAAPAETGTVSSAEAPPSANAATSPGPASPTSTTNAAGEIELDSSGDDLDADIAALSKATAGGAERKPESKPTELAGRDIVYRVTAQGLVIEVGGIHLRPEAKAVKEAGGTYAVQLTLTVESFDERQYWLAKPAGGPLAIAGKIEASGSAAPVAARTSPPAAGTKQRFTDQKRGEAEQEVVRAGEPRKFKQRWPGKGQPKLHSGQTLTLEIGLWGVHADTEPERAVKRLFELKLVAADPPQAVISPPALDWGS